MFDYRTALVSLAAIAIAASTIGVAGSQAAVSIQPDTTCSSSSPCTTNTNNGSGPAIANVSVGGTGSTSTTDLASTSSKFAEGMLGVDASSKGTFDIGVEGTSVSGTGVKGMSHTGSGVFGTSKLGDGVSGTSNDESGFFAGVFGTGAASGGIGVEGSGTHSGIGVLGIGTTAVLAEASSSSSTLFQAAGTGGSLFDGTTNGTPEFTVDGSGNVSAAGNLSAGTISGGDVTGGEVFGNIAIVAPFANFTSDSQAIFATVTSSSFHGVIEAVGAGGPLYTAYNSADNQVFYLDDGGNLTIGGLIKTAGSCSSGCIAHGPHQKRIISYASQETQPTVEDLGEAQVVNGQARVALDPSFANVIDPASNYLVFVTPEGDCNGLYIAGKSSTGFVVRELRGGHSSLAFEYRIVAKPFGDHSARLPEIVLPSAPRPAVQYHGTHA